MSAIWTPTDPVATGDLTSLVEAQSFIGAPFTKYMLEVAWGQATGGLFTFGATGTGGSYSPSAGATGSQFYPAGTDQLAASGWSASFNVPNADLSSRARRVSTVRGRDDLLSVMQAGTLTADLTDPDGLLNVKNPASPLYGSIYTGVPIRWSGYLSNGTKQPLFYGFIDTITADPAGRYGTAQITASDFFNKLGSGDATKNPGIYPNLGSLTGATDKSLYLAILNAMRWTDPAMMSIGLQDTLPSPYTRANGTLSALALIEESLIANRGYFYMAAGGAVTYRTRNQIIQSVSRGTISKKMRAAPSGVDGSRVVNRWTVTRVDMAGNPIGGSTPQVAAVPTTDPSYLRYGYVDGSITTSYLLDDNHALGLAQYMVAITKSPIGIGWQVPIVPPDVATLDQLLTFDLGDRVTLTVDPLLWAAYTGDHIIQQIRHDWVADPSQPRHVTTWGVTVAPSSNPFTFGVSTYGGPDFLTY
jgi:hypothetical protein